MTAPGDGPRNRGKHALTPTRRKFLIGTGVAAALGVAYALPSDITSGAAAAQDGLDPDTELAAVQEVKQLKARYFRSIDTKNWDLLREQLADDVVVDTTGSMGPKITGADKFIRFLKMTIGPATTAHHGHMPEIEVTSPTTAKGVWAMQDLLLFLDTVKVNGYGHYHETYSLVDGRWVISTSKLTRVYMDPLLSLGLLGLPGEVRL
ncbi:nuclear transport factor 2 family protein [Streptomyces sp. S.PB5]|uniref:nuclear transport factor 2 family protein n=1 Tax=Streptomyces sp. S.PB5 TaxID=3020844 RepID=UPI0025AFD2C2|nr:nuclear transport factor 2 family protein [Streptomyces sp. S.PB5]MDN3021367.1 nuclear transport factor 2 family protein [Streptomyces sp. S.PB5]